MKRFAVAFLAAALACGAAWSSASAQENNGHHYGWQNRDRGQYVNQCTTGPSGQYRGRNRRRDNDDRNNDDNGRYRNGGYGQYGNGQSGQYGNGQYGNGQYGRYNNTCGGQYGGNAVLRGEIVGVNGNQVTIREGNNAGYGGYGNNGGYGGYGNNGGYGGYGNNGGYGGYGQTITIDDQPALDNRTSGRVSTGRYVTAYGYWQNGIFHATRMN